MAENNALMAGGNGAQLGWCCSEEPPAAVSRRALTRTPFLLLYAAVTYFLLQTFSVPLFLAHK